MHSTPKTAEQSRHFDFYNAGQINGQGNDLIMFCCYRRDGSFGSCHLVEAHEAAANRSALVASGYTYASRRASVSA